MKHISKIFVLLLLANTGCKKLVEIESPTTRYDARKVYEKDESAIAVLTGIYQEMSNEGILQGKNSITFINGLYADELIDYLGYSVERTSAFKNQLLPTSVPFWSRLYYLIYTTNTAIEGISTSETLTPIVKDRLLGEAKFLRAFFYFYLTSMWGDVPLPLSSDYLDNTKLSRESRELVLTQIVADLKDAGELLSEDYLLSDLRTISTERIRPNRWVAKALLAKAYLLAQDYEHAEDVSTEIIANNSVFFLTDIGQVFSNTSQEAIWQIQSINVSWNTFDAKGFILATSPNFNQPVSLSNATVDAFENDDLRREKWVSTINVDNIQYYFPTKYKSAEQNAPKTEALTVFRLAEQFLIRAEARLKLGNMEEAVADINVLRSRARGPITSQQPNPLPNVLPTLDESAMESVILHERQVELFTEMGNRWLDIQRSPRANDIMQVITNAKGTNWNNYRIFFPVPLSELNLNSKMTQNEGYN
jgi:starch-binding outer membrane protein, SusD/RagB family